MPASTEDLLRFNRVILSHFDSYSAMLAFARWDSTMLLPAPLPASATPMPAPPAVGPRYAADAVTEAACAAYGLNPAELFRMDDFDAWMQTEQGPIRVHLLRFNTFAAPAPAIQPRGGVFKTISELRGCAMVELTLLRQVFNLIVGGGGR